MKLVKLANNEMSKAIANDEIWFLETFLIA